MFVTNWISTTKIQKISEITNFFRHYFLSRTEVYIKNKPYSCTTIKLQLYDYTCYGCTTVELWLYNYRGYSRTTIDFPQRHHLVKKSQISDYQ